MCIERFLTVEVFETMPARSAAALKRQRVRRREFAREWKKENPEKVREQKRRYRARRRAKRCEVRFKHIAGEAIKSLERKNGVKYNHEKILRKLFRVRIGLTDFRRPAENPEKVREQKRRRAERCEVRNEDMYDPDEIL